MILRHLHNAICGGVVPFCGAIDEVQVYPLGLSGDEVLFLFQNPSMVAAGPVPQLSYVRSGEQLILTWTSDAFVLQENSDLNNVSAWIDLVAGERSPVQTTARQGMSFFRLRRR